MHKSIGIMQINVPGSGKKRLIHTTHNLFRAQQNKQDRHDFVQPLSNSKQLLKTTDITKPVELLPQDLSSTYSRGSNLFSSLFSNSYYRFLER